LAHDLDAQIRVLATYSVPFAFSLDHPPAEAVCTEKLLADWIAAEAAALRETSFHLYLCRDGLETLGQVLEPNSLVVIGSKRLWPNNASFIAWMLRSIGHHVIFVRSTAVSVDALAVAPSDSIRKRKVRFSGTTCDEFKRRLHGRIA
jgi:hypothetical protein